MASELGVRTIQHTNGTTALTIAADGTVTAAQYVKQSGVPAFSVVTSANHATTSADSKITTFVEDFDIGGHWDTANSKFVAPQTGVYSFSATCLLNTGTGGTSNWGRLALYKNSVRYQDNLGDAGTYGTYQRISFTVLMNLNAGDEIELWAATNVATGYVYSGYSRFSGYLVG